MLGELSWGALKTVRQFPIVKLLVSGFQQFTRGRR